MGPIGIVLLVFLLSYCSANKGFGPGEQDYGYVNVRPGAQMFWWLYHTTANVTDSAERPLMIYLEGGPGGSSCGHGNFLLVGPLDEYQQPRDEAWTKKFNVLFIDSPVGAGFSYVDDLSLLSDNNADIAKDMIKVLKEFFGKNPKFKTTPLYLYGISYGGKLVPDFAKAIHEEVSAGNLDCSLKGIAISEAWVKPVDISLKYAEYLYGVSLVDKNGEAEIDKQFKYVKELHDSGNLNQSTIEWLKGTEIIWNATDGVNMHDVRDKITRNQQQRKKGLLYDVSDELALDALMNGPVKEALNLPDDVIWGRQAFDAQAGLFTDFLNPILNTVTHLLNNTDIEVYVCNANFDLIVNTQGVLDWIDELRWNDESQFRNASRITTWINNTMEGYERHGGRFHFYWINVAGHVVITDNSAAHAAFLTAMTGF